MYLSFFPKDCDDEIAGYSMECRLSSNLPTNLPTKQENRENTVYLRCFKQVRFPSAALWKSVETLINTGFPLFLCVKKFVDSTFLPQIKFTPKVHNRLS